ncbi:hypothetical protein FGE12_23655 [Aggregicoccus sp. 17bor-14]|uniref:hypothetical protein n=1 Tax=Myxococcaceae TaxID=31 RepID=UPI00129CAF2B|nr:MULTISPECIES: hypothetical protein [Myxococcaceae]MBF5045422.1 hypothetical protein [Simulacricoccus sp. 17bor-14]MRI91163.1 hypothetical protein [Aggregicoccus sp. 17bor-14]
MSPASEHSDPMSLVQRARDVRAPEERERLVAASLAGLPSGGDARDRALFEVALALWRNWRPEDLALTRLLVRHETQAMRREHRCGDAPRALCFLLHLKGEARDATLIYEAKTSSFDAACSIEVEMLSMHRTREEMGAFLDGLALDPTVDPKWLSQLREWVLRPFDASDYESHVSYCEGLREYFGM